jgi:hypothetical protein
VKKPLLMLLMPMKVFAPWQLKPAEMLRFFVLL